MRLLVGCPVMDRAWVIRHWLDHATASAAHAGVSDVEFLIVGDRRDPTMVVAQHHAEANNQTLHVVGVTDERFDQLAKLGARQRHRQWNPDRYKHMATVRNRLLRAARGHEPDVFFSVDSDILLAEHTIASALDALNAGYDAVAAAVFLTPGKSPRNLNGCRIGNHWGLIKDRPYRPDELYRIDIPMAAVAMNPAALACEYLPDTWGEDKGFARSLAEHGLTAGMDTRTLSKHVYRRDEINKIDPRLGW